MTLMAQRFFTTVCHGGGCGARRQRLHHEQAGNAGAVGPLRVRHVDCRDGVARRPHAGRRLAEHWSRSRARDQGGPKRCQLRAEIHVGGMPADFGTLSAAQPRDRQQRPRDVRLHGAGRAQRGVDSGTVVAIVVTPTDGGDFDNAAPATGVDSPGAARHRRAAGRAEAVVHVHAVVADRQPAGALRRRPASTAANGNAIASYSWNFGDGRSASGRRSATRSRPPGTYVSP